jgi:molecular chaperone DnaK (HSP70)
MAASQSASDQIVVGLDYGTTFSAIGIAYGDGSGSIPDFEVLIK